GHPHPSDGGSNRTQPTGKPARIPQPHLDLLLRPGSYRNPIGLKIMSITPEKGLRFSPIGRLWVYRSPFAWSCRNPTLLRPGPNPAKDSTIKSGTAQVMQ